MENTAYLLRCCDGSYYAGWTNDLPKRVRVHQAGKGAKYTRARLPVELCYYETFATKAEAMQNKKHAPSGGAQCPKLGAILLCWNGSSLLPVTDVAGERFLAQCRNGTLYDDRFLAPGEDTAAVTGEGWSIWMRSGQRQ